MKNGKVYLMKSGFALAAALALAGCAATTVRNEDSGVIRERAVQRWEFLIAHKADKAYDLLSPGYRETKTREKYTDEMNARGIRWSKVSFGSQDCAADTCKVHLQVDYSLKMGGPAGTVKSMAPLVETWVQVKGKWYYLPSAIQPSLGKEKES